MPLMPVIVVLVPAPRCRSRFPSAGSPAQAPRYWRGAARKSSDFPRVAYPCAKLAVSVVRQRWSLLSCCVARASTCRHHLSFWRLMFRRSPCVLQVLSSSLRVLFGKQWWLSTKHVANTMYHKIEWLYLTNERLCTLRRYCVPPFYLTCCYCLNKY